MVYLGVAYGVIIAAILGYTLRLWVNERSCRRQMDALSEPRSPR